jgi:hypothetical protein
MIVDSSTSTKDPESSQLPPPYTTAGESEGDTGEEEEDCEKEAQTENGGESSSLPVAIFTALNLEDELESDSGSENEDD